MFDERISASIRKVNGSVKDDGDIVLRRIRFQLERTFSAEVAHGLGSSADVALAELESRGLEKVVIPIGGIKAAVVFEAEKKTGQEKAARIKIGDCTGLKATALVHKAGGRDEGDGEAHPIVRVEFETLFTEEAWVFLGRHLRSQVNVTLTKNQLDLPGTGNGGGAAKGGSQTAAPANAGKKAPGAAPTAAAKKAKRDENVWQDPQQAKTPEEAEAIRVKNRAAQADAIDEMNQGWEAEAPLQ